MVKYEAKLRLDARHSIISGGDYKEMGTAFFDSFIDKVVGKRGYC